MEIKNNQHYPLLDYLRAFAAIWVVLYHSHFNPAHSLIHHIARFGALGVDLFFLLSGFLIANQTFIELKKNNVFNLKKFYLKRMFRIWPNYFFLVLVFCFMGYFLGIPNYQLSPLLLFFTLTQNYVTHDFFGVSWSLCVEEHFYFFFPLIIAFLVKIKLTTNRWLAVFSIFIIIELIFRCYYWFVHRPDLAYSQITYYKYFYYMSHVRLSGLVLGIMIAIVKNFKEEFWHKLYRIRYIFLGNFFILLYIGMIGVAKINGHYGLITVGFGNLLMALSFCSIVLFALQFKTGMSGLLHKLLSFTSLLSYAIYLTHMESLVVAEWLLGKVQSYRNVFISAVIVYLIAYLLYRLIEKPFMVMRKRFT